MGYTQPSRKRTVLGTAGHKTLQILAERKLKDNQDIIDDEIGVVGVDASVDDIVEQSFNYYTSHNTHIELVDKDLRDLKKWVNSIISSHVGKFDPRNQNVVACELPFVIESKEDWAKYKYSFRAEEIEGYLKLKGTIDLAVS